MKRLATMAAVLMLAATGCAGSSTPDTSAPVPAASTPAAAASLTCAEYPGEAAHLVSYLHYASLNVGTTNDANSLMTEMSDSVATLKANAPACAPEATAQLDELATSVAALKAAYVPGADPAAVAADKAAIEASVAKARAAWVAMKMDTAPWDTVLKYGV